MEALPTRVGVHAALPLRLTAGTVTPAPFAAPQAPSSSTAQDPRFWGVARRPIRISAPQLQQHEEDATTITLIFICEDGSEVPFEVTANTKTSDVIAAYCQKQLIREPGSWRFTFDGNRMRVDGGMTVKDLEFEDGDLIDVSYEKTGGCL